MRTLKCYIAGPLFSQQDRSLLERISSHLEAHDVKTFLPHRDGGDLGTIVFNRDREQIRSDIFEADFRHIKESDLLVCLLDGQDSDSGTCVELGIALMANIPIFGLKTDLERRGSVVNNMVWGACESGRKLFSDVQSLFMALNEHVDVCKKKGALR